MDVESLLESMLHLIQMTRFHILTALIQAIRPRHGDKTVALQWFWANDELH